MKEWIFPQDPWQMNWVEGNKEWGTVIAPEELSVRCESRKVPQGLEETYIFTNISSKDFFSCRKDIGIYTTFNDNYTSAEVCMKSRCHTHIWCGEQVSYVCALRMGGAGPHLGLVLLEGSLSGYGVEREWSSSSDDRGDFILHPAPVTLLPGESFRIRWLLFSHEGWKDFWEKVKEYCPTFLQVEARHYIVFRDEVIRVKITPVFAFTPDEVSVKRNGKEIPFVVREGSIVVEETPRDLGVYSYQIAVKGVNTHCQILVQENFAQLVANRCHFIAEKQQYHNPDSDLRGAYLIYDNQEGHMYYGIPGDYNGARERVCMGILMAGYLQEHQDPFLEKSLAEYVRYVKRELLDLDTGVVYNDYQKDSTYKRLYNSPWFALLFLELYTLYGQEEDLTLSYRIMKQFYAQGGWHFYAIEVPLCRLLEACRAAGRKEESESLLKDFRQHCDTILKLGTNYPAHEVKYEQSIVAPAAWLLMQMYRATGEEKYKEGAELQLRVLELFQGEQPDYHLHQVAIRHWDGFWFGKRKTFGDTFPHYWSGLTANVFREWARITGEKEYEEKAEDAFRGVLSLYGPDGSASCACVYPLFVNGEEAGYYDPFANDQDWGIYFYQRKRKGEKEES